VDRATEVREEEVPQRGAQRRTLKKRVFKAEVGGLGALDYYLASARGHPHFQKANKAVRKAVSPHGLKEASRMDTVEFPSDIREVDTDIHPPIQSFEDAQVAPQEGVPSAYAGAKGVLERTHMLVNVGNTA
jgi:hypothetical protein